MSMQQVNNAEAGPGSPSPLLPEILHEAARYWESRRILYNLMLAALVVAWVVLTWPHFDTAFTLQAAVFLVVLFGVANVCYSAAYPIDILFQFSPAGATYRQWRWILWLVGMLLTLLAVSYWIADEIYPYVNR